MLELGAVPKEKLFKGSVLSVRYSLELWYFSYSNFGTCLLPRVDVYHVASTLTGAILCAGRAASHETGCRRAENRCRASPARCKWRDLRGLQSCAVPDCDPKPGCKNGGVFKGLDFVIHQRANSRDTPLTPTIVFQHRSTFKTLFVSKCKPTSDHVASYVNCKAAEPHMNSMQLVYQSYSPP